MRDPTLKNLVLSRTEIMTFCFLLKPRPHANISDSSLALIVSLIIVKRKSVIIYLYPMAFLFLFLKFCFVWIVKETKVIILKVKLEILSRQNLLFFSQKCSTATMCNLFQNNIM